MELNILLGGTVGALLCHDQAFSLLTNDVCQQLRRTDKAHQNLTCCIYAKRQHNHAKY